MQIMCCVFLSFFPTPDSPQRSAGMCLREGMCRGVRALLEEARLISREMLTHAQLAQPRAQVIFLQLHCIL